MRRKNSLISLLIVMILLMGVFAGCKTTETGNSYAGDLELIVDGVTKYNLTKKNTPVNFGSLTIKTLGNEIMPIAGFIGPSDNSSYNGYRYPSQIRQEVYDKIAAAGVNMIYDKENDYVSNKDNLVKALQMAEKSGLTILARANNVIDLYAKPKSKLASVEEIQAILEEFRQYSSFVGLFGRDEPDLAPNAQELYEDMKIINKRFEDALKEEDGDLFVKYNTHHTDDATLSAIANAGVKYFSFDLYSFRKDIKNDSDTWLKYVRSIRKNSIEKQLPWWGYVQTGGDFPDVEFIHRRTTEGEILWQINIMLAYGAKGISYFPLVFPPDFIYGGVHDGNSLINLFGNATEWYYYAQKANKQVAAIDSVLMKSASMGIVTNDTELLINGDEKLPGLSWRELKTIKGDPVVVGCFDYQGGTAVYVVNSSTKAKANTTLTFDKKYGYDIIQRGESISVAGTQIPLQLENGEGVLIVLK